MNKYMKIKEKYAKSYITKAEFIDEMDLLHQNLYEYEDLLNDSLVEKIEISSEGVIAKLKDTGIKLHCIKKDKRVIPIEILNFGEYEEQLWDKVFELLDKPYTIFDIGGNIGYFSLYIGQKFPTAKFYTFEPITKTFDFLQKNLLLNKTQNISAFNIGLSSEKQEMEMFFNPELSGNSSLKDLSENKNIEKMICKFSTLDDFAKENKIQKIDFIKCDVEGAEKFVFEGGLETIKAHRPIIFTELLRKWSRKFDYHPNDILKIFKEIDYKIFAISNDDFYEIEAITDNTKETNFVLMP